MSKLLEIITLTAMAGLAMPAGGLVACLDRFQSKWLVQELRHSVTAFGGGVLLSAVALVLVPEGVRNNAVPVVVVAMLSGGVAFLLFDQFLAARKTPAAQLTAMLSDFIPEAMALGAAFASERSVAFLLALLIALQNLPEGFNAFRELAAAGKISRRKILLGFTVLAAAGPIAGTIGWAFLASHQGVLDFIMLFAAGGILYLIFQDIAPQARLERRWAPALGAVAGFLVGVVGQMFLAV